jgi:hypothetical protein
MAKSVARLDRVKAIYNGHIESVVHNAELQNGFVVVVGGLKDGNRDLRSVVVPTAKCGDLALIYHSEINPDESKRGNASLQNFSIEAGKAARAYRLEKHDIFSVSYDGLTLLSTAPVVGNKVVAQTGLKLKEIATADLSTEIFVGDIIELEQLGTATLVGEAGVISRIIKLAVIEVLSN